MTGLGGHWAGGLDGIVVCKPTKISSLLVPSIFVNGPNDGAHMGLLARSLKLVRLVEVEPHIDKDNTAMGQLGEPGARLCIPFGPNRCR